MNLGRYNNYFRITIKITDIFSYKEMFLSDSFMSSISLYQLKFKQLFYIDFNPIFYWCADDFNNKIRRRFKYYIMLDLIKLIYIMKMRIEIIIKDKIDYIEYATEYKLFDSVIINSRYYHSIDKITLFKRKDILTIQPDITNTYY